MSSLIVEVCKISSIEKHPNADKLDIATVKGWNCIIGKGDFKVGDLIIFIPPDSLLSEQLLAKYNLPYLRKGSRVKTVKLRGFISEGLILPLQDASWKEGRNVAEEIGITKWVAPERNSSKTANHQIKKRRRNPNFDKYTDIENIRNFNSAFVPGDNVVVLEKIHGANWRIGHLAKGVRDNFFLKIWDKLQILLFGSHELVYGSHNVQLRWNLYAGKKEGYFKVNIYEKIAKKYNFKSFLEKDYIVYGEVYGPQVQKGFGYGLGDGVVDLVVFDVKYKGNYISYPEMLAFCKQHGLPTAPELFVGEYNPDNVKDWTSGNSLLHSGTIREGCVIKSIEEIKDRRIGRKILKSISPEYSLLKYKDKEFTEDQDVIIEIGEEKNV